MWFVRVLPLPLLNIMINRSAAFLVKKTKVSNIQIVFKKRFLFRDIKWESYCDQIVRQIPNSGC